MSCMHVYWGFLEKVLDPIKLYLKFRSKIEDISQTVNSSGIVLYLLVDIAYGYLWCIINKFSVGRIVSEPSSFLRLPHPLN